MKILTQQAHLSLNMNGQPSITRYLSKTNMRETKTSIQANTHTQEAATKQVPGKNIF